MKSRKSLSLSRKGRVPSKKIQESQKSPGLYDIERLPLPSGFVNKNSCCYANSVFQCFMNVPTLKYLQSCLLGTHFNACTTCKFEGKIQNCNSNTTGALLGLNIQDVSVLLPRSRLSVRATSSVGAQWLWTWVLCSQTWRVRHKDAIVLLVYTTCAYTHSQNLAINALRTAARCQWLLYSVNTTPTEQVATKVCISAAKLIGPLQLHYVPLYTASRKHWKITSYVQSTQRLVSRAPLIITIHLPYIPI